MESRSRPRPSPELIEGQREAKVLWHRRRAQLPIREKIRLLLDMQRNVYPIICQRREPRPWERPWIIDP